VILFALALGLVRAWTSSILPGIIAHLVLNGASPGILLGGLVYVAFSLWANKRSKAPTPPIESPS
jgi:membrane protease YdiL (CAAX protease family)